MSIEEQKDLADSISERFRLNREVVKECLSDYFNEIATEKLVKDLMK